MKFQLTSDWPVTGDRLVPVSTIIDTVTEPMSDWSRLAIGKVPPINCVPLSQDAYDALRAAGFDDFKISRVGDGVVRRT